MSRKRSSRHLRYVLSLSTLTAVATGTWLSPLFAANEGSNKFAFNARGEVFYKQEGGQGDSAARSGTAMVFRDAGGNEIAVSRPGDPAIPPGNPAAPPRLEDYMIYDYSPFYDLNENGQFAFVASLISSTENEIKNGDLERDGYGGYGGSDTFLNWILDCGEGEAVVGTSCNSPTAPHMIEEIPAGGVGGSRAVQMIVDEDFAGEGAYEDAPKIIQDFIPEEDQEYVVIVWAKVDDASGDPEIHQLNGDFCCDHEDRILTTEFQPFVIPDWRANTPRLRTYAGANTAGKTITIDDVRVILPIGDGEDPQSTAVYTGQGDSGDLTLVAVSGQTVDGNEIHKIIRQVSINDRGQVAFEAELVGLDFGGGRDDRNKGVFRYTLPTGPGALGQGREVPDEFPYLPGYGGSPEGVVAMLVEGDEILTSDGGEQGFAAPDNGGETVSDLHHPAVINNAGSMLQHGMHRG